MLRDMKSNVDVAQSLAPAARTNGTSTGADVNLTGYGAAEAVVAFGAWTDGTHTASLQESSDGTTYTAVAASDQQGTFTAVTGTAGQNAVQRVGYVGNQPHLRAMMVTAGATTGALSGVNVNRGKPLNAPLA